MKCNNCGAEIDANSMNCPICGVAVPRTQPQASQPNQVMQQQPMMQQQPVMNQQPRMQQQPVMNQQPGMQQQSVMSQQPRIQQQPVMNQQPRQQYQQMNNQNINRPMQNSNMYNGQYTNNAVNTGNNSGNHVIRNCIIVVVAVAILVLAGFGVYFLVTGNNRNNGNNNNTTGAQQDNNNTPPSSSSYVVEYGGFKFYIPDNLIYEIDNKNKALNVSDADSTWIAQLTVGSGTPYQQIKKNPNTIRQRLLTSISKYSGTVSEAKTETIDGKEFILFEISYGGRNSLAAITELNSMTSLFIEIANEDNEYNKDILKNIVPIAKNAEGTNTVKKIDEKMKTNNSIDVESILKVEE